MWVVRPGRERERETQACSHVSREREKYRERACCGMYICLPDVAFCSCLKQEKEPLKNKGKLVLNRFLLSGITDVVLYRLQYMCVTQPVLYILTSDPSS